MEEFTFNSQLAVFRPSDPTSIVSSECFECMFRPYVYNLNDYHSEDIFSSFVDAAQFCREWHAYNSSGVYGKSRIETLHRVDDFIHIAFSLVESPDGMATFYCDSDGELNILIVDHGDYDRAIDFPSPEFKRALVIPSKKKGSWFNHPRMMEIYPNPTRGLIESYHLQALAHKPPSDFYRA